MLFPLMDPHRPGWGGPSGPQPMEPKGEYHRIERSTGGPLLRDVILGGQDGLVNILGIILGVIAVVAPTRCCWRPGSRRRSPNRSRWGPSGTRPPFRNAITTRRSERERPPRSTRCRRRNARRSAISTPPRGSRASCSSASSTRSPRTAIGGARRGLAQEWAQDGAHRTRRRRDRLPDRSPVQHGGSLVLAQLHQSRMRLTPASGWWICCIAPPVARSPRSIAANPASWNSAATSAFALSSSPEMKITRRPPAVSGSDAEHVRAQRVGGLHDARARNEVGDELARRSPLEIVGCPVVGRVDDDLTVPVEALYGLAARGPRGRR